MCDGLSGQCIVSAENSTIIDYFTIIDYSTIFLSAIIDE